MRRWRSKFVFFLIVYFAGFATAIYTLAPGPEKGSGRGSDGGLLNSAFKSDDLAKSFNTGMHKCVEFGKEAAWRVAKELKEKVEEKRAKTDG